MYQNFFKSPALRAMAFSLSAFALVLHAQTSDVLENADRLADQGNWIAAGPLYSQAEAAFRRAGDARQELYAKFGRLHRNVEEGSYRAVRTEATRELANPIVQNDPQLHIRALSLLGSIDLNLNTAAALNDWSQIRVIAEKAGDAKWGNRANGQLGLIKGLSGNLGAAALALNAAITKAEEIGDFGGYIFFASALAEGMTVNAMSDRALTVLDKAEAIAKKNGFVELPLQLQIARVRALINSPESERERSFNEAGKILPLAMAQAQRERTVGAQTDLLNAQGQIAVKRNDFVTAEKAYRQAADLAASASLWRLQAEACLNLSRFYRSTKEFPKASAAIDGGIHALQLVEEGYDLPVFVAEKAEVLESLGSVREADETFRRATSLVEGLLVNAPSSRVKSSMIAALSDIYLGHFRLAWNQMHDAPYAFEVIENARGRAIRDSIRYTRGSAAPDAAPSKTEIEIARLQRALLHNRLTAAQTEKTLEQLDHAYIAAAPEEFRRKRGEMLLAPRQQATVRSVQMKLHSGETLVEYVLDEGGSHCIQVTSSDLRIIDLPPRSQFSKLSRSFVAAVRNGGDSLSSGQELYKQLVAPVVPNGTDSLIVVPDGPLNLVPFSALRKPDGHFLTESVTLSASPSASVYELLSRKPPTSAASKPFLGVAFSPAEQTSSTPLTSTRGLADLRSGSLKPLRFAREEVTEAAKAFGVASITLEGAQASEAALKAEPLGQFRVIHIAAHGMSDELEPDRAALVLAPGSESEDGLWQVREIVRSRLNAAAVVLSACETGTGRLQGQEGVMNMARAFLTAGSGSVVASLWDVDDRSTATLMERLYVHLQGGSSVSEALRAAQQDFLKDYGDKAKPNLWAGFEVIGYGATRIPKN